MDNSKKQPDIDITASSDSDKRNVLDLISILSDLRSQYSCFNDSEREVYHTLSEAIKALRARMENTP